MHLSFPHVFIYYYSAPRPKTHLDYLMVVPYTYTYTHTHSNKRLYSAENYLHIVEDTSTDYPDLPFLTTLPADEDIILKWRVSRAVQERRFPLKETAM